MVEVWVDFSRFDQVSTANRFVIKISWHTEATFRWCKIFLGKLSKESFKFSNWLPNQSLFTELNVSTLMLLALKHKEALPDLFVIYVLKEDTPYNKLGFLTLQNLCKGTSSTPSHGRSRIINITLRLGCQTRFIVSTTFVGTYSCCTLRILCLLRKNQIEVRYSQRSGRL